MRGNKDLLVGDVRFAKKPGSSGGPAIWWVEGSTGDEQRVEEDLM